MCLCGSTRFVDAFRAAERRLALEGAIALSVGFFSHAEGGGDKETSLGAEVAAALDRLHLRKVDLADEVLVLNVGGYVGASTAREVEYARSLGKSVRFLEPVAEAGTAAFCAGCGPTRAVDARCVGCGSTLGEYERRET